MTDIDYLQLGYAIAKREVEAPATAYERFTAEHTNGEPITLCDRDLVLAAREAVRRDQPSTATVALTELALRMGIDEPIDTILGLVA